RGRCGLRTGTGRGLRCMTARTLLPTSAVLAPRCWASSVTGLSMRMCQVVHGVADRASAAESIVLSLADGGRVASSRPVGSDTEIDSGLDLAEHPSGEDVASAVRH